ncbi:hypothetical protein FACS189467_3370 [Bacteroidia bacterium]|nr:hypothetical protein FACS189467_3370 [Bacteroidia bacterium]
MKTRIILLFAAIALAVSACQQEVKPPVSVILDTDMGCDYDDVGALTMLHALADSGEVRILATLVCLKSIGQNIGTDVINHYYGRPDLPLGRPINGMSNDCEGTSARWLAALDTQFPHRVRTIDDVPDAVEVYRRILAGEPDTSVVVVTIGALTNLSNLLQSPPDKYSPLDGKQLVAKKVKHLVAMAGIFPEGVESNSSWDAPSSAVVFEQWIPRIIFSGWEIGNEIVTGKRLIASDIQNTPAKEVYTICGEHQPRGRESWDQTAILVAVRGVAPYFNTVKGQIKFEKTDGYNSWQNDPNGNHEYLTWKMPPEELTMLIEDLMMHEPVNKSSN